MPTAAPAPETAPAGVIKAITATAAIESFRRDARISLLLCSQGGHGSPDPARPRAHGEASRLAEQDGIGQGWRRPCRRHGAREPTPARLVIDDHVVKCRQISTQSQ